MAEPNSPGGPAAERRISVRRQLDRILESSVFRGSKRCQHFLRYVVEQALEGREDVLKERTLGIEIFERPPSYDTSEDAIVRVKANEVRKRLAQYYVEAGHEHEVRIDLPPGSYVPEFHGAGDGAPPAAPALGPRRRRARLVAAAVAVAVVLAGEADLGLVSYPEPSRQLAVIPWRQEQMVVAAAPSHPLAPRGLLRSSDLEGQDFVAFDPELPIRRDIDRFLREAKVEVNVIMHFDNIQMIKEAVALGSAISVLPFRTMQAEIEQGRLVAVAMDADLVRPVGIIHRRRKRFHRAAQVFLELLQEQPPPVA